MEAARAAQQDAATNLLTATPAEAALGTACALTDPRDLLALALACRRFFTKCIAAPPPPSAASGGTAAAAQQAETWSIIQEAARQWITTCADQEQGWVPRRGRESWLGLMWEVESLRCAVVLGRSHESITLSEGGSVATKPFGHHRHTAASKAAMRAGRHYAQFTVEDGSFMCFGAIRPGWDVQAGHWWIAHMVDGHCFYSTGYGYRYPGAHDWEGSQTAGEGDRIGMLLDLDQGSMTVYKNDERLGVMAVGLSGEYCWAVSLGAQGNIARIEAAPAPASPTAEELAQAAAYEAEQVGDDDY
eukprot:COSAG06_NODE_4265_length_4419_cov_9.045139_1_plen_302_part_00